MLDEIKNIRRLIIARKVLKENTILILEQMLYHHTSTDIYSSRAYIFIILFRHTKYSKDPEVARVVISRADVSGEQALKIL